MPVALARISHDPESLKLQGSYEKELSDTSATSHDDEHEEEDYSESDASDSDVVNEDDSDDESFSGSHDDDDESSSWGDDDGLEEELRQFTLGRAASCSKLGGGFPNLGPSANLNAKGTRKMRRCSSLDFKTVGSAAGLVDLKDLEPQDDEEGDYTLSDRSESDSEGLDEQLEQLKASVGSMYNMPGLNKPTKAVAPSMDGDLSLVENNDQTVEKFFKNKAQPLTIIQTDSHQTTKTDKTNDARKPADVLRSILQYTTREAYPASMWEGYFLEVQNSHIRAHTKEMELTVRAEDYDKLRAMIRTGQTLQSCNQHGESIIHLACRRSSVELLKFMIKEAQVTVRVRDDYGRSPLHDTCWSYNDRFDIFKALIEDSPELLFIEDKRGFSPFDYIPKQRWDEWNGFLEANADFLRKTINVVDLADMDAYYQSTR